MKRTLACLGAIAAISLGMISTGTTTAYAASSCSASSMYADTAGYHVDVTGNGVVALQKTVYYCYGQNIEFDGVFGPATEATVKKVQAGHGLIADGVYGPNTRDGIRWHRRRFVQGDSRCLKLTQAPGPLRS